MYVMDILPLGKTKSKVLTDEDFAFSLYNRELAEFGIVIDGEIPGFEEIIRPRLRKRGMERSFYLLKAGDRTERELRKKLTEGVYPPDIIDEIIESLKEYGYIDDRRYARLWIDTYREQKSRHWMAEKLYLRGIDKGIIRECLEEDREQSEGEDPQIAQILSFLQKKLFLEEDRAGREKIIAALGRKGYPYRDIKRAIEALSEKEGSPWE